MASRASGGRSATAGLSATPRVVAQRRHLETLFGEALHRRREALPSPREGSARPRPAVVQLRLSRLLSATVDGWQQGTAAELSDWLQRTDALDGLIAALRLYERTPDEDPVVLATALDALITERRGLIDRLDAAVEAAEVRRPGSTEKAETLKFVIWLIDGITELRKERDDVVLRLPVVTQHGPMLKAFPDGRLSVGEGIRKIAGEGEPAIGKDAAARQAGHAGLVALPFGRLGEPEGNDVIQGALGDCWLLAPLISLANSPQGKARLAQIIQPNDRAADVYVVTLHKREEGQLISVAVPVSSRFVAAAGAAQYARFNDRPLWPAIIEKAFATMMGNDYDKLSGSTDGALTAFEGVLGVEVKGNKLGVSLDDVQAQSDIEKLIGAGARVVVSSATHYYSVAGKRPDGLDLRNPHGTDEFKTWAQLSTFTYQSAPK